MQTVSVLRMSFLAAIILTCCRSALCLSDREWQDVLEILKKHDSELEDLEKRIRDDNVGWWDIEIVTSSRTNRFQRRYVALKGQLEPVVSGGIEAARRQGASVDTMGQALASLPEMIPLLMTLVAYKGQLDHIEFMIESRRSVILGRFSVYIAISLGSLSIVSLVFSVTKRRWLRQNASTTTPQDRDALRCGPAQMESAPNNAARQSATACSNIGDALSALNGPTNFVSRHILLTCIVNETYKHRQNPNMRNLFKQISELHIQEFAHIGPTLKKDMDDTLPRVTTFQKYARVLTEDHEYERAIEVCESAISFRLDDGTQSGYEGRIARLRKKMQKANG